MKISELSDRLGLVLYGGSKGMHKEVQGGYCSDLLSDVMGHARPDQVWITVQTHKNVIAVASLKELAAVIIVQGLQPAPEVIAHSDAENIPLLGTSESSFEIAGKIHTILRSA